MEPVGFEPTSKRPPNQTLNYTFTCSILRSPSLEQKQWGCKMLELAQPTRNLVETNYCVVMNRPIAT